MTEFAKRLLTTLILLPLLFMLIIGSHRVFSIAIILLVLYTTLAEWPRFFTYTQPAFWLLLPVYILFPFLCLIRLHSFSPLLTLFLCITVSTHDIGSYSVGKLCGRHLLWPAISPGKTWEGFFGGCITTLVVTLLFYSITHRHIPILQLPPALVLLAFSISVTALAGDLLESYLKRNAGIKDSGTILPGHGGVLDRFDALMLTSILFYYARTLLIPFLH